MSAPKNPQISARKLPKQARSTRLVDDILEAAAHVLARDGAHRFTTSRVAERAGVSVGSLYQYFPNKQAILFRLQADEWKETGDLLQTILADRSQSPQARLRLLVRTFFRTECEEADLRIALGDAVPLYRDAPETAEHWKQGRRQVAIFMCEALPEASARQRALAADVMMMSMGALGKAASENGRSPAAVDALAVATGDMFCAYLDRLAGSGSKP